MASQRGFGGREVPHTLTELLEFHTTHYAQKAQLNFRKDGRWTGIPSKELGDIIRRTALGLYGSGVRFGDRVGLLSENTPSWVIADFAITALGAVTVPIYTTQVAPQIEYILTNAGVTTFLISSRTLYERVEPILHNIALRTIVLFDPDLRYAGSVSLTEIQKRGSDLEREQPELFGSLRARVTSGTIASIIYTSGTTGEPKGVVLTHGNLVSNAIDASSVADWFPKTDRAFSYLPLSHIFERTLINIYLYCGIPVYFAESIEAIPANLLEVRPTIMATVPRLLEKVYEKIRQKGSELKGVKRSLFDWSIGLANAYDSENRSASYALRHTIASLLVYSKWRKGVGGRFRFIISGGASLPLRLGRVFCAAGITILQGYGLTETSPVVAVNRIDRNRLGTVGPVIPNVEVSTAADGELLVRGPNVMKEFYGSPEATAAVFEDTWFHTGDLGHLDRNGFLIITGRKRDLIKKSTGKFVAPEPIESKLLECKYVEYAVLIGEGRKFVVAVIFPNYQKLREWAKENNGLLATNRELIRHPEVIALFQNEIDAVNSSVNHWEKILRFLLVENEATIDGGDLTPTLKLRRAIIEEKYKNQIAYIYEEFEQSQEAVP